MGSTGSLRRTVFYAATSVVKPGLFAGIRAHSSHLPPAQPGCSSSSIELLAGLCDQTACCAPLLLSASHISFLWLCLNSVFCWAARGESVVATLPGSTTFQLHYHQQTASLLRACLSFPNYKKGGYLHFSVEDLWMEKHQARHYCHFWPREFQHWGDEVPALTDGCPLCVGASHRARVSKTDIHGDICSSVCPSLSKFLLAEEMVLHHHVKITNKQIPYDFYMRNKGLNLDCVCEER